jgi:aminoacyl-tRNA hydrolase
LDQIVAKAEGVPLFVEELTKVVLEAGVLREEDTRYELKGLLPPAEIPATLQDSLMARLGRLAPVKEIAQIAAVIGREFSHELLAAVVSWEEKDLNEALRRLVAAELIFRRGVGSEAAYVFKHALVRDAAYATLLCAKRRDLHGRVVQVLENLFPDAAEASPELLAHHCAQAGMDEKAVAYWARAGQRALERSANAEAVGHLMRGLALLEQLPEGDGRRKTEAELQISLGDALRSAKRYGHEMERAYGRARELCEQLGEISQLIQVVYGQYVIAFNRPKIPAAAKAADELLRIAQDHESAAATVLGHYARGATCFAQGNMTAACTHLQQALALPDRTQQRINESGRPIARLVRKQGVRPGRLIVVQDELDLAPGVARLKVGGGTAGHNGLRSIEAALRSRDFLRIRIGVGKPPSKFEGADHVLSKFTPDERTLVDAASDRASEAIHVLLREGVDAAQNLLHTRG